MVKPRALQQVRQQGAFHISGCCAGAFLVGRFFHRRSLLTGFSWRYAPLIVVFPNGTPSDILGQADLVYSERMSENPTAYKVPSVDLYRMPNSLSTWSSPPTYRSVSKKQLGGKAPTTSSCIIAKFPSEISGLA
jgi:hypothetical protein